MRVEVARKQFELGLNAAHNSTDLYILKGDVFPRTSAVNLKLWTKIEYGCENCEHGRHSRIDVDIQMITDGRQNMNLHVVPEIKFGSMQLISARFTKTYSSILSQLNCKKKIEALNC